MVRKLALVAVLGGAALIGGTGCGTDDTADDDTTYNCSVDDRGEPFTANMTRTGTGGVTFTIVSATPALPIRGDNVWVVDVQRAGAPLTDATVKLTPFMPDHRHGSPKIPVWTPDAQVSGRFIVSEVNLWMPGVWELTFEATPAGGTRDSVLFTFCLTG